MIFLALGVSEIKISSILLSKLRGLVEISWVENLKRPKSWEISLLLRTEYFSFIILDSSLEMELSIRVKVFCSWNLFAFTFWFQSSKSVKQPSIDLMHYSLVLGREMAMVVSNPMYCLVERSYFNSSICLERVEM